MTSWRFPKEWRPHANAAFRSMTDDIVIVPTLPWSVRRNVVLIWQKRDRLSEGQTARFLNDVGGELPIEMECDSNKAWVLSLARLDRLSVYDADRLELAQTRILLFANLDSSRASHRERCQPWHRAVREVIVAAKETGASCGNNVSLSSAAKATCAIAAPPIVPA